MGNIMRRYKLHEDKVIDGIDGIIATLTRKRSTGCEGVCPLHTAIFTDISSLAESLRILSDEAKNWSESNG